MGWTQPNHFGLGRRYPAQRTVGNKTEEEEDEGRGTADRAVVRSGAGGGRRGGMAVVYRGRCWLFFLFLCIFLLPFFYFLFSFPLFLCSPFILWQWRCC
jgi:hypothetical protein